MRHRILLLFTLAILVPVCSALYCQPRGVADEQSQAKNDGPKDEFSEIALEQSGSFGVPSGYKVVLRKDGAASYSGDSSARLKGDYHGRISKEQFDNLAALLREKKFLSMEDKYDSGMKDAQTITVSVESTAGRKTVVDYNGGRKLSDIAQAINKLSDQINWEKDR